MLWGRFCFSMESVSLKYSISVQGASKLLLATSTQKSTEKHPNAKKPKQGLLSKEDIRGHRLRKRSQLLLQGLLSKEDIR